MEAASLILGSIALLSCTCLYLAVPCGALAVIFATLSRGGMMSYTSKAQIGMILGIIALIATIVLYASVLGYAIHQYGSIDGWHTPERMHTVPVSYTHLPVPQRWKSLPEKQMKIPEKQEP